MIDSLIDSVIDSLKDSLIGSLFESLIDSLNDSLLDYSIDSFIDSLKDSMEDRIDAQQLTATALQLLFPGVPRSLEHLPQLLVIGIGWQAPCARKESLQGIPCQARKLKLHEGVDLRVHRAITEGTVHPIIGASGNDSRL